MRSFISNTLKSFAVLFLGSLSFVLIITIFPLIGSVTMDDFPLVQAIKDNFKLLIPLLITSLLISPLLGWASSRTAKKRFLILFLVGLLGCWLAVISVMFMWLGFTIFTGKFIVLSLWGSVAYSLFSLPVLVPVIIVIERWTRNVR